MKYYVGFDVGGTKVKHAILSEDGTILQKENYQTKTNNYPLFLSDMIATIKNYQTSYQINGIAISFPGYINSDTGYIDHAGTVGFDDVNLVHSLERELSLPVTIENDANCAALAEKFLGNAQDCDDFVCMTIGTAIGGGIFVNGNLLHGKRWRAGEFGAMNMAGVNEEYLMMHDSASTSGLIKAYKRYMGISENENIEGEVVFEATETDENVKQILDSWLTYLSRGIMTLVCTLNPERVLIGGGVSAEENLLAMIDEKLNTIPMWEKFKTPLEVCYFRNDAGLLGALYHHLKKNPT